MNRPSGVGHTSPGQVSWVAAQAHAEAGDDRGGLGVEEQLEVVRRIVEVDRAETDKVVASRLQIVSGPGEPQCRDLALAGAAITSGVNHRECGHASEQVTDTYYIAKPVLAPDVSNILEQLGADRGPDDHAQGPTSPKRAA
jgi:hypothetical protein